ncbi:restriction endonuclease [Prosthecobacter sp.]|uniref:restriction endonuclease n=1 Tax=Prosthecobacter sp. TaxID=1965333 RepID=UPI003784C954
MPIPTYQEIMLPLLRVLGAANEELHQRDCSQRVAEALNLTEAERQERLPSGSQTYIHNRCGWAGWYMQQAGLVEKPRRAHLRITDEGRRVLGSNPATIDNDFLATYPSFREKVIEARPRTAEDDNLPTADLHNAPAVTAAASTLTPTDQIEQAHARLDQTLVTELLDLMARMDAYKFEHLVLDLLVAMGYGGSRAEAAKVTQKSNDEGIDGIIHQDRLGLDVIYVQAKRWQSTIGREQIQNFVGALAGKHASKGVFITTSDFNSNAVTYARTVQHKIILIDGQRLAELMIEHGIGVSTVRTIAIKRVDSDYFEDA